VKKRYAKVSVLSIWIILGVSLFYVSFSTKADKLSLADYQKLINETYDYRFGAGKPFAPSNANSFDGNFIPGEYFISATRCAECHTDIHPQWRQSAHANAFKEPFYQKNVKDITKQKDIAFTRHCEACHNPAALFTGALTDKPQFKSRPFDDEGVSCIACHSIESVNLRGVGGYTMGQPALLQKPDGTKIIDATNQEILNNVADHKRAMMRDVLKKPEFCASCHKSQVPHELNDYKFLRAFMVGDELQQSSFSKESPHPYYVRNKETCNTCHMKQEAAPLFDVSAKNGTVVGHRWAASNTAIPAVYGFKEQLDQVNKFLADDKMGVDIFAIHRQKAESRKEKLFAPANHQDLKVEEGDLLTADVVVTNKNIGHGFPPELRDFYEAYVEFTVADSTGKTLYKSGFIKPDGYLDEWAHAYKTYLVKEDGSINNLHFIWQTKTIAQNAVIPSGRSDVARYKFKIPAGVGGNIKLTAALKYRRFTRVFSDYALGKKTDLPIVTMATTGLTINVGSETKAQAVDPKGMPDWRRWNNYGIALLDQRQFPQAADAFDEVSDLDPKDYKAFALTNKALALIEMGGWKEAESLVSKALEIDNQNLRAMYQLGRIDRSQSRLDKAESEFKKVLDVYPRDRLSLQQLGELAKIKSDIVAPDQRPSQLEIAEGYYDRILAIDPEDAGAHYNLMIIYQKLGRRDDAKKEAVTFKDLKDDPSITNLAGNFLQSNSFVGMESLPFHTHSLSLFDQRAERTTYIAGMQ
jgi:tetratricopeptide (TPR) repeat protein